MRREGRGTSAVVSVKMTLLSVSVCEIVLLVKEVAGGRGVGIREKGNHRLHHIYVHTEYET